MQKKRFYSGLFICLLFSVVSLAGCNSTRTMESTGQFVDNSLITTKVKAKLFNEMGLDSLEIKVKSFKDAVQLSGFVDNAEIKSRAARITWSVPGVQVVKNDLILKSN